MTPIHWIVWLVLLAARVPATSEELNVGYQGRVFDSAVGRDDIRIAVELWAREITSPMDITLEPQVRFYDTIEEVERALVNQEIHVITLATVDFMRLRVRHDMGPALVSQFGDNWAEAFVLLVREDAGIHGVDDLRGHTIITVDPHRRSRLPTLWLKQIAREKKAQDPISVFDIQVIDNPSSAILAVLFGQNEATVVSRQSYETMVELNPQVGRELVIIAESDGMLPAVTCIPAYVEPGWRRSIIDGGMQLHEYPKGQQILTLFGITRVVPFQETYLRSVDELINSAGAVERVFEP